jgi:energy-coupling factor transport system permease protein
LYGLTDGSAPAVFGWPLLMVGSVAAIAGLAVAGKRVSVTRYRQERWQGAEFLVAALGWFGVIVCIFVSNPLLLTPSTAPPNWPTPPWIVVAGVAMSVLAGVMAPLPPDREDALARYAVTS